ncbi:MAG: hypothetical protein MJZ78_05085 [Bacteroidales bacterium]|nr:hypothetical protein [Bacteroidales bacterium]
MDETADTHDAILNQLKFIRVFPTSQHNAQRRIVNVIEDRIGMLPPDGVF